MPYCNKNVALLLGEGQQVLKLASEIFKAWREVNKQLTAFKQANFCPSGS
jgi:hypothetical protein